jgi:hypothetical protein
MGAVETQRTLVKSLPELWEQLTAADALGRMFDGQFGEIRITRLEPEATIAWEGELAAGLVELEPSGLGTRVRLSAELPEPEPAEPEPAPRRSLLARLLRRPAPVPPAAAVMPETAPAPAIDPDRARGALTAVLDEVGAARHRPFSRD